MVVAVACLAAGGCGSEDRTPSAVEPAATPRLTESERAAARAGERAIRSYCRALGLHLAGRRSAPGAEVLRRAVEGARAIALIAQRKPGARYTPAQTARQLAGDTAEDLEGTNCSGRLVAELRGGLRRR